MCFRMMSGEAVVPGYYLVCYNQPFLAICGTLAVVPGYYLVCYNSGLDILEMD